MQIEPKAPRKPTEVPGLAYFSAAPAVTPPKPAESDLWQMYAYYSAA